MRMKETEMLAARRSQEVQAPPNVVEAKEDDEGPRQLASFWP